MYEEISESSNTEQQVNPAEQQFGSKMVAERPELTDTTQDATAADWAAQEKATINADQKTGQENETDDLDVQLDSALELMTPIECFGDEPKHPLQTQIREQLQLLI
jgi:hypothetical protein